MTRSIAMLAGLAACSASHHAVDLVNVYAFAGESDPAQSATVLSHDAMGKPFQAVDTDAAGFASIEISEGGTITVVFPAEPTVADQQVALYTVTAPPAGSEIDVHGRAIVTASAAGVVLIQPMATIAADTYIIELGCTTSTVAQMPASITISTLCVAPDGGLDVLVIAESAGQPVGYVAGRVPVVDGFASFQPAAWTTTSPTIPVVASVPALLDWTLVADGRVFGEDSVTTAAPIYTGLVATGTRLIMQLQGAETTRYTSSVPAQIAVDASDFLPAVSTALTADGYHYTWTPQSVGADAIDLHFDWMVGTRSMIWELILPPDSSDIYIPQFGGDLGTVLGFHNPTQRLSYFDATTRNGYDDLLAGGLYDGYITPVPTDGELRTTQSP